MSILQNFPTYLMETAILSSQCADLPKNHAGHRLSDVVIVGGGLAGLLAATLLARKHVQATVIDAHDVYPANFRAEQIVGDQVTELSRLGLLDAVVGDVRPVPGAAASRKGVVVGSVTSPHYGIHHGDMVRNVRRSVPSTVHSIVGRVVGVDLSARRQTVYLADGTACSARLVVIATGMGLSLLAKCGIKRNTLAKAHSLAFGFDVTSARNELFFNAVQVAYGERQDDRIDYLTVFPIGDRLRANLFTFGNMRDHRSEAIVSHPSDALQQAMPGMTRSLGALNAISRVERRPVDLYVATGVRQDGLVLIGDAFQAPCPAAGTGIGRMLSDIDHLCLRHIPDWLMTEGMGAGKIAQFYDDPAKQAYDAEALRQARYRRSLVTETSLSWQAHRQRLALQNRLQRLMHRRVVRAHTASGMVAAAPSRAGQPAAAISR